MGIYLNPGAAMLRQGRNSRVYVDKSGLLGYLDSVINTEQKCVCVSRPRRFGKTMAANMVCAYYDRTVDGAAEFAGLEIASSPSFDAHRNRYDVLHINMQEFLSATHDAEKLVDMLSHLVGRDLARAYPDLDILSDMGLPMTMADCCAQTGTQFVIVIDEWGCDFDECRAWYDGYRLEGTGGARYEEYSPKSVVEAVTSDIFESYWTETEAYEALKRYIDMDMDGLRSRVIELVGGVHVPLETRSYANDMTTFASADDVLTLLVHLGYLGYDARTGEAFVPNREVLGEFAVSTRDGGWSEVARSIRDSESLLASLVAGDAGAVAAGVERAHEDASSVIAYNDENALAATLRLAFFSAIRRWRLVREAPAGRGFADLTLVPLASSPAGTPGVVIELKYGDTAEAALAQIRERGYDRALDGLVASGDVVLCGIAYDPKAKTHSCVIERA